MKSDREARQRALDARDRHTRGLLEAMMTPPPPGPQYTDTVPQPTVGYLDPGAPVGGRKARAKPPSPAVDDEAMNKGEARYAGHLERRRLDGTIRAWRFHAFRLKIAPNTFSRPDFWVVAADGTIEIHEYKGPFVREDSRLKTKAAAVIWPELQFVIVTETGPGHFEEERLP